MTNWLIISDDFRRKSRFKYTRLKYKLDYGAIWLEICMYLHIIIKCENQVLCILHDFSLCNRMHHYSYKTQASSCKLEEITTIHTRIWPDMSRTHRHFKVKLCPTLAYIWTKVFQEIAGIIRYKSYTFWNRNFLQRHSR